MHKVGQVDDKGQGWHKGMLPFSRFYFNFAFFKSILGREGKMRIDTVIFDLDGTLVDTEPAAVQAIETCFKRWGIRVSPQDTTYITGRTWATAVHFLNEKYNLPFSENETLRQLASTYRNLLERNLKTVPGSVAAVRSLAPYYDLGLVSGSNQVEITWVLKKLEIYDHFNIILGAEDYSASKPDPEGYLKAMEGLSAHPRKTLVFEDSQAGISSARSAGLWVVAVTGTNYFHQNQSEAHDRISDLRGITPQWVSDFSTRINNAP